jgi:hypothetical protein
MNLTPGMLRMEEKVIALCEEVVGLMKTSLERHMELGDALHRLRGSMDYGLWGKYVKERLPISEKTVSNCIRLAENRKKLVAAVEDRKKISDLTYSGALALLAKPKKKKAKSAGTNVNSDGGSGETAGGEAASSGEEDAGKPEPPIFTDPKGTSITKGQAKQFDGIVTAFAIGQDFQGYMTAVSRLKSEVAKLADEHPVWVGVSASQWKADCNNLRASLRFARPHAICPWCEGNGCPKKEGCRGAGWVSEGLWQAVPRELKEKVG